MPWGLLNLHPGPAPCALSAPVQRLKTQPCPRDLLVFPPCEVPTLSPLTQSFLPQLLTKCVWIRAHQHSFNADTPFLTTTMYSTALSVVAVLATLLPATLAQTHTDCNPLNTTGCPDMKALGGEATFQFNDTWNPELWVKKNQGEAKWTNNGTSFRINARRDAPYIASSFYLFFGRVEVIMRAAPGQGIISSAILQSECLDEIDWEFKGGNTTHVATNYYGKGNDKIVEGDPARGIDFPMKSSPQDDFHNYTLDWTKDRTQWWLDGEMLRELKFADAKGGAEYPQTPMNIRLGAWAGGDTENNAEDTVSWAGGETNFDDGPYTMMVKSVFAEDYTSAQTYSWADMDSSGSFEKVKVVK